MLRSLVLFSLAASRVILWSKPSETTGRGINVYGWDSHWVMLPVRSLQTVEMVSSPGVIQQPTPPSPVVSWLHFTPQWCTTAGRSANRLASGKTADECKEMCEEICLGVEWWEGSKSCYKCTDPSKKVAYTETNDKGYPPHVFLKSQNSWIHRLIHVWQLSNGCHPGDTCQYYTPPRVHLFLSVLTSLSTSPKFRTLILLREILTKNNKAIYIDRGKAHFC